MGRAKVFGLGLVVVLALAAVAVATLAFQPRPVPVGEVTAIPTDRPPLPTRPPVKAYIIGDSVTAGAGVGKDELRFGNVMAGLMNWEIGTDGQGGTGFVAEGPKEQGDQRFVKRLPTLIEAHPDLVIVAGGRNDMFSPKAEVKPAVTEFFRELRKTLPNARLVTIAGWRWDTSKEIPYVADQARVAGVLKDATLAVGGTFIDPVTDLTKINDTNAAVMLSEDQFHPSAEGYDQIGHDLARVLVKKSVPRGPEVWRETGVLTGKYVDANDQYFQ